MNREQIHRAFRNYDEAFAGQMQRIMSLGKSVDKIYLQQLQINMMWDCLMTLLEDKGVLLSGQFAQAMKELADETAKRMEEEAKKKAEPSATPPAVPEAAPVS
jgi:hypothetical protein